MRNRYKYMIVISLMIADIVAILILIELLYSVFGEIKGISVNLIHIAIVSWVLPAVFFRMYNFEKGLILEKLFRDTWRVFVVEQVLFCTGMLFLSTGISVGQYLWQITAMMLYLFSSRVTVSLLVVRLQMNSPKIGIWGFSRAGIKLASYFERLKYKVQIINEDEPLVYRNNYGFNNSLVTAIDRSARIGIKELYVVAKPGYLEDMDLYFRLADSYCLRLRFVPDFSGTFSDEHISGDFGGFQTISARPEPLEDSYNRLKKRAFDILVSLFVLLFVMSWLYPILAVLIKWEDRGPVLFKQLRTGENNRHFWCYKFRSMKMNTDSETRQAQKRDERITTVGQFIRKTSIDELPQFYNVLIGEMSVVGPRPHMLKHTLDYSQVIPNFMVRHFVKPGITGLSQVSGFRGETKEVTDMQNRVDSDIEYLKHWSFIKDLKICLLTVITVLKGDENAF